MKENGHTPGPWTVKTMDQQDDAKALPHLSDPKKGHEGAW